MKPLLSLSSALVVLSFYACGRNTPGVAEVSGQTAQEVVVVLEDQPVPDEAGVGGEPLSFDEDPFLPQLADHDGVLLSLLSDIRRGTVKVKKALPEEGIDRPYIEISGSQLSEPVLIFPYLDTLSKNLVLSKITAGPGDYIIAHQIGGATTAKGIVDGGMHAYLSLLGKGQTVTYPVYEEDAAGELIRVQ